MQTSGDKIINPTNDQLIASNLQLSVGALTFGDHFSRPITDSLPLCPKPMMRLSTNFRKIPMFVSDNKIVFVDNPSWDPTGERGTFYF